MDVEKKPTNAEMRRALLAAGYRARRFDDERFTRWSKGDGAVIGRVRCTSWLATEMAYRMMIKRELSRDRDVRRP